MSNLSLQASLRTCKVNQAHAQRMETDRFLNSDNLVCPTWNGVDTAGRPVQHDTYRTETRGCYMPSYRIGVENHHRPQYSAYVNLNTEHLQEPRNMYEMQDQKANSDIQQVHQQTGQFGHVSGFKQFVYPSCGSSYDQAGDLKKYTFAPKCSSTASYNGKAMHMADEVPLQKEYKQFADSPARYMGPPQTQSNQPSSIKTIMKQSNYKTLSGM